MIRVVHPAEPASFDLEVRSPGTSFLATTPTPINREWRLHGYWRRCHAQLHTGMMGICVYSGSFTPRVSGRGSDLSSSIDHFVPKSRNAALAYEWSNLRLCRTVLNHRKGDHLDVVDPVTLPGRWFILDLTTFRIEANTTLADPDRRAADATIRRLALNDDDALVAERARVVFQYALGHLPKNDLQGKYPFIDSELTAHEFDANHRPRFQALLTDARVQASLAAQGWI